MSSAFEERLPRQCWTNLTVPPDQPDRLGSTSKTLRAAFGKPAHRPNPVGVCCYAGRAV